MAVVQMIGRCRRLRGSRAGLVTPYPQAGPFPHRFALGDRSGSARKRVPSPIASLWGTDRVVPAGGALPPPLRSGGQTREAPEAGAYPHRCALGDRSGSTRKRVPSPIASLWGTDPVVPASGSLPPSLRSGGQIR